MNKVLMQQALACTLIYFSVYMKCLAKGKLRFREKPCIRRRSELALPASLLL